jgi:hypothetical protein
MVTHGVIPAASKASIYTISLEEGAGVSKETHERIVISDTSFIDRVGASSEGNNTWPGDAESICVTAVFLQEPDIFCPLII